MIYENEDEQIMALLTRRKAYAVIESYLEFLKGEAKNDIRNR